LIRIGEGAAMGNVSQDTRSGNLLHVERVLLFAEKKRERFDQGAQRWMRNSAPGLASYLANFLMMAAAIVAFASFVATPGLGKEYSRHPAIYEPSLRPAYEPAYPTVYEPSHPNTHRPGHEGYQTIGYDYANSHYYLRDYLYYFWNWLWCNIVLIIIIVIIVWLILRAYYSARIDEEFKRSEAAANAAAAPAAVALLMTTRKNLPV
jgi:hypothetical protein